MGEDTEHPTYGYGRHNRPPWTARDRQAETVREILRGAGFGEFTNAAPHGQFAVEGANASLDDDSTEPYYVACISDDLTDGPHRFAQLLEAAGYQVDVDPDDDQVLIVRPTPTPTPTPTSAQHRLSAATRPPLIWGLLGISFGATALAGLLGDPPAAGARAFRFVLPLLVLLAFLTARLFTGRVSAPIARLFAVIVFLIEAPVIYVHLYDLARAHRDNAYTAAGFAVLLVTAMVVSMAMVLLTDRFNRLIAGDADRSDRRLPA